MLRQARALSRLETPGQAGNDNLNVWQRRVERHRGSLVVKPQKSVDADDTLAPEEGKLLKKAEQQMRRCEYVTLAEIDHEMDRTPRGRGRKTA